MTIYIGPGETLYSDSGLRLRLQTGQAVDGELGEWLLNAHPKLFRRATDDEQPRLTVDTEPGDLKHG